MAGPLGLFLDNSQLFVTTSEMVVLLVVKYLHILLCMLKSS